MTLIGNLIVVDSSEIFEISLSLCSASVGGFFFVAFGGEMQSSQSSTYTLTLTHRQ
jgi:hypothetical protein